MQSPEDQAAIAAMGNRPGPDVLAAVQALFCAEQDRWAAEQPVTAADLPYGDDPRQTLDLHAPAGGAVAPILLWVHGGGFLRGEKRAETHPYNAHVGRWAARQGMLGAVMNYRLAPSHGWPAGGEDVGAAIGWLRAHGAAHGGDPERIVVMGTSAGAVHVATLLRLRPNAGGARAAILLSGLYGYTPLEDRDSAYYGPPEGYADRAPRAAMEATELPLMLACAEHDPPRFQAETLALATARLASRGAMPRLHVASGHNHFSLACHIGTADTRLTDEILAFLAETLAQPVSGRLTS